jgi:cbb3-type cytochrome oxidase maturation protein
MSGMAAIIACALLVGLVALVVLLWAIGSGQYDDLEGDANRILLSDLDDDCAG